MYPRNLMIELSRECNLACAGCFHESEPGRIDIDTFTRLITAIGKAYAFDCEPLPILHPWFYSEPLMVTNLDEYLKKATGLGYKINLTTNGTICGAWDRLIVPEINYHILVLSIDGLEEQTYRAIRGVCSQRVADSLGIIEGLIAERGLTIPICIKLTKKGIEWAETCDFIAEYLADQFVKMVSVSDAFGNDDGPSVARNRCRYLDEFFVIQHDLKIAPCCMRWKAITDGMGIVSVDDPMGSFDSDERAYLQERLLLNDPASYCVGCLSSYTGGTIGGLVNGVDFSKDKPVPFKQDFYNTFYFNTDWMGHAD